MDQKMNSDLKFYVGRDGDISRFSPLVLQTRKQAQRCVQHLATNGKQSSQDSALSRTHLAVCKAAVGQHLQGRPRCQHSCRGCTCKDRRGSSIPHEATFLQRAGLVAEGKPRCEHAVTAGASAATRG